MMALTLPGLRGKLPLGRDAAAGYVPWLVALMVYVAAMSGIGLVAAGEALTALDQQLSASMTVQIPPEASDARVQTVLGALRQTHGVASVHLLDAQETAQLLAPWLGSSPPLDVLPVPRLIDLRITPDDPPDLAKLRQQLASILPEAGLEDHRTGLVDLRHAAHREQSVLGAVVALCVGLIAVVATFATQSGLVVEHEILELVHMLGAPDREITRQLIGRAALIAIAGAVGGAVAALLTDWVLGGTPAFLRLPTGSPMLAFEDWRLWAVLAAAIVAAGAVATASAQITVRRRLARLP